MLDLAGTWELCDDGGTCRCPISLPGDGISALHEAGLIPDPYAGRNAEDLGWIAARDWTARRRFRLERQDVDLVVSGLDTVVEIRLNGQVVHRSENAFRRWRVDLSGAATTGENEIEITFRSSLREAAHRAARQPYPVPYHAGNCPLPHGNMLRKPACDFGWDWNVALAPFGVTGQIAVEPRRAARLADVEIAQTHGAGLATISLIARIDGDAEGETVQVSLGGARTRATISGRVARFDMAIEEPELWWPAGHGMQPLYDLELRFGDQVIERRIGLRTVELIADPDASGRSFGFRVNGRDIFVRGANWVPADALAGRITPEAVEDLLRSARDANMNMIRVWGGGRYEPDWFYDLCDELGLLVWQDFMFACHLYPATEDFLAEVDAEVRDVARRLHHHPALALWCGDNEIVGMLNQFPEARADRDRYLVAYDRLNRTVATALTETLPHANWWASSPSAGPLDFRDAWHEDGAGDMHVWTVWHEGRDADAYREVRPRFCSEFGFQSYPSRDVVARFAGPEDRNIAAPVMQAHQKDAGGNARIAGTMFRQFRFPMGFDDFVYLSQVQQGLALKTAVEAWRATKPHCAGMLYWQLNDTWPGATWSTLDHGGGWKLSHHMARRFYRPVSAIVLPEGNGWTVVCVNDLPGEVDVEIEVEAITPAGRRRPLGAARVAVPPDRALAVGEIDLGGLEAEEMVRLTWRDDETGVAQDLVALRPWKAYDLQPPGLEMATAEVEGTWHLTLATARPAFFVALEADRPGRFSDNAFALVPGEEVTVTFIPQTAGEVPAFGLRDLHSATYGESR